MAFERLRNFFRAWTETKAIGNTTVLYSGLYSQRPAWDMTAEIKEGLESNSVVYACVNLISTNVAAIPWYLNEITAGGPRLVEDDNHPLLVKLRRPNPTESGARLFRKLCTYWYTTGNFFLYGVGMRSPAAQPLELWSLRPDKFTVYPNDSETMVKSYGYWAQGKETLYTPLEVLHGKCFESCDSPWWGLSPVRVGSYLIDGDNKSVNWNRNLINNRGRPDAIFNFKGGLTNDQRESFQRALEDRYSGSNSAGKPMVAEGSDFEYQELSKTPQELDFIASTSMVSRRICQCFNVAPELIGDPQNKTYSNQQEARLALIEQVVFPFLDYLRDELNNWLTPRYGDNLRLEYDRDYPEVTQLKRQIATQRVQTADWLSVNEQRVETGFDLYPDEDADVPRALASAKAFSAFQPMEPAAEEPEEEAEDDSEPEEDGEEAAGTTAEAPEEPEEEATEKAAPAFSNKVWGLKTDQEKAQAFYGIERQRQLLGQYFAIKFQKHFRAERDAVTAAVRSTGGEAKVEAAKSAIKAHAPVMAQVYRELYTTVGKTFFDRTRYSMRKDAGVREKKANLQDLAAEALRRMRVFFNKEIPKQVEAVTTTTEDKVSKLLRDMIFDNKSDDEIVDALTNVYDEQFIPNRSVIISDTETVRISNYGSIEGAKSTGLDPKKYWLDMQDSRVRDGHHRGEINQGVDIDKPFVVRGQPLMWPGDDSLGASADNIINCRCALSYDAAQV